MKKMKMLFISLSLISFLVSFMTIGNNALQNHKKCSFFVEKMNIINSDYILVNFWASYDAESFDKMVQISNEIKYCEENLKKSGKTLQSISISFDKYKSVYEKTMQDYNFNFTQNTLEEDGFNSKIAKEFKLKKYENYLLDGNGNIISRGFSANELKYFLY